MTTGMPDLSPFGQSGNGMKKTNEASPLLELMQSGIFRRLVLEKRWHDLGFKIHIKLYEINNKTSPNAR
jgi:hypothetical protein